MTVWIHSDEKPFRGLDSTKNFFYRSRSLMLSNEVLRQGMEDLRKRQVKGNLLISYVCSLFGPRKEYQSVHLGLGSSRRY